MVRPVEGYMAEDGTFFPTESACEIYEARLAVTSVVMERLDEEIAGISIDVREQSVITEYILEWVYENFDKFERFVKAKRAIPTDMPEDEPAPYTPDEIPPAPYDPDDIPI